MRKTWKKLVNYITCSDCLRDLERILAVVVLAVTVIYFVWSLSLLGDYLATPNDAVRYVLESVLTAAIGVELARLLLFYNLNNVVELLIFVVARKLVLLEDDYYSLLIGMLSIGILFGVKHYFDLNEKGSRE